MHATSENPREGGNRRTTTTTEDGVHVVTVRARPSVAVVSEMLRTLEAAVRGPDAVTPFRALVDIRQTAFAPSGQEIRLGAARLGALGLEGRVAVLVAGDFQYGLVRMLGLLSEDTGIDVQPFRDPDEADRWIRALP